MGLTSDHIPVEEMLRSSALWLEKLPKASNANEEMMIFASYLINILAKNADPMDGNKIAKYNNYTNKRLCYCEDGQGEEWPQAPDILDRNLLAQAHHPCPLRRGTGKSHVVRRMIIYVELLDVSTSAAHVHQENGRSKPPFLWSLTGTPCKSESSTPSNVHDGQRFGGSSAITMLNFGSSLAPLRSFH